MPGWVRPLIATGEVIAGNGDATVIFCWPVEIAKSISSAPAALFAAMIASRRVQAVGRQVPTCRSPR